MKIRCTKWCHNRYEGHPDPFARLTNDSAMGNLLFRGRTIESPGATSTERKLSPMVRCGVSHHEKESAARYSYNTSKAKFRPNLVLFGRMWHPAFIRWRNEPCIYRKVRVNVKCDQNLITGFRPYQMLQHFRRVGQWAIKHSLPQVFDNNTALHKQ